MLVIHMTLKLDESLLALLNGTPSLIGPGDLRLDIDAQGSEWDPAVQDYTDLIHWRTKVCRAEQIVSEIVVATDRQFEHMHRLRAVLAPFKWHIEVTDCPSSESIT